MSSGELEMLFSGITVDDGVFAARGNAPDQAARVRQGVELLRQSSLVEGMKTLRMCLAEPHAPPIDAILDSGIMPLIVVYLDPAAPNSTAELLHEASWAMLNMLSGNDEQTTRATDAEGTVPAIIALLRNRSIPCRTREHAAWAIGNIAGTRADFRDELLNMDCFEVLVEFTTDCTLQRFSVENGLWAMCNLARSMNNQPAYTQPMMKFVPQLVNIVSQSTNMKGMREETQQLLWLLAFILRDNVDICDKAPWMTELLGYWVHIGERMGHDVESFEQLAHAWLTLAGDISAGDDAFTIMMAQADAVSSISSCVFVTLQKSTALTEAQNWSKAAECMTIASCGLWALSNIAAVPDVSERFLHGAVTHQVLSCLTTFAQAYMTLQSQVSAGKFLNALSQVVKEAFFVILNLILSLSDDEVRAQLYIALCPIAECPTIPALWVPGDLWQEATQRCLIAATVLHAKQSACAEALVGRLRVHAGESFV